MIATQVGSIIEA